MCHYGDCDNVTFDFDILLQSKLDDMMEFYFNKRLKLIGALVKRDVRTLLSTSLYYVVARLNSLNDCGSRIARERN